MQGLGLTARENGLGLQAQRRQPLRAMVYLPLQESVVESPTRSHPPGLLDFQSYDLSDLVTNTSRA
jgi:hypothetical protein